VRSRVIEAPEPSATAGLLASRIISSSRRRLVVRSDVRFLTVATTFDRGTCYRRAAPVQL